MVASLSGCSVDSAKSRYILAEKLWTDGKYAASVKEFERVAQKDPRGKLGLQALFRAAMTQTLYLSEHMDAIRKFRSYVDASDDTPATWEAQKQIGEILFSKTEQYEHAIAHYRNLLKARPKSPDSPELLFRVAKGNFFLWQFDEAAEAYEELIRINPGTPWAERAAYEVGVVFFTRGEQHPGKASDVKHGPASPYQQAIQAFQKFTRDYPRSNRVPEAQFGIASCLEELDQLDAAYQLYESIRGTYPSPKVIEIKLARIRERKAQKSR